MALAQNFGETLWSARKRLRIGQAELAHRAEVSRRTLARWEAGERAPDLPSLKRVVAAVHAFDARAAEELAAAQQHTLVSLGVVAPRVDAVLTPTSLAAVDSAVCAAADVIDAPPRAVRPALLAALRQMKTLGVTIEAALRALEPRPAEPPAPSA